MYLNHWNLREQPFQNVVDPRFAYLPEPQQEALARLVYVVQNRKLGTVLTGAYGVGKTMLLELLARHAETMASSRLVQFDAPPDGAAGLARCVLETLESGRTADATPAVALDILRSILNNPKANPTHTTLAIDEAQDLRDRESFEFLHRLTNFRLPTGPDRPACPAFTVVLCGLPELNTRLAAHHAFRQRLTMGWNLDPLTPEQTLEYVAFRMRAAGGDSWVFEEGPLAEVARVAGGIPRLVNNICDAALMLGFAQHATRLNTTIIHQAIAEVLQAEDSPDAALTLGDPSP